MKELFSDTYIQAAQDGDFEKNEENMKSTFTLFNSWAFYRHSGVE